MTDYSGVNWRVNYGEIAEREQFRVGYVGQDSYEAYFEVSALTELIDILNTVQPFAIGLIAKGVTLQAQKVDAGHTTAVVIEPLSGTNPEQIMRLDLGLVNDLIYALQLFQTNLPKAPEADDWSFEHPYLFNKGTRVIKNKHLPASAWGFLSVKDFGAVGNGVADDTRALQKAFDAAGQVGGILFVPAGTFLHSATLIMPSNVSLLGGGSASVIYATSIPSGGPGLGHRQIDASNKTRFSISHLTLDNGDLTAIVSGVRTILCINSTHYTISDIHVRTPGAATASVGSSYFDIINVTVDIASTTGAAVHDGIIDQWGGCHDFRIISPTIRGAGLGRYGILVTGEDTAGLPAGCYNFSIHDAQITNMKLVGIWINGREGINRTFTISDTLIDGVADFFGIAIADSDDWTLSSPVVKNVGSNGIRVYSETSEGGSTGGRNGTIPNPVIVNANQKLSGSSTEGAAILIAASSVGVVLASPRVKGTTHTYAATWSTSITNCSHIAGSYDTGTLGVLLNDPTGGNYTPVTTPVTNVTSASANAAMWHRDGQLVTVTGRVTVTPAATGATQVGISLPVPSNLASASTDLAGVGATQFGVIAAISADITNDRAQLQFSAASTAANILYYSFTYQIL